MPGKASMESLCEFFEINKEDLLKEDDPIAIISNVQKKSKKTLLILLLFLIPVILYCIALTIFAFTQKWLDKYRPLDGVYYSEKYLEKFDLGGLDMIDGIDYQLLESSFYSYIDSYEVFDNYVNYVYNRLQYSTTISYISTDKKIYNPSRNYADLYLIPSNELSDHIDEVGVSGKAITYEFYFFSENTRREETEYLNCNYLYLQYSEHSSYSTGEHFFHMQLVKTDVQENTTQKIYLVNDFFEIKKIEIKNENYSNYLSLGIDNNREISFAPHGTFIIGGYNPTPIPPFNLFVKVKFYLYDGDTLINEIEKFDLLTYCEKIYVTHKDFNLDSNDFSKYRVELDFEILENSYYYDITKKEN